MNQRKNICVISAERVPLVKVGGLGDVVGALSDTLADRGHSVTCFMPAYATLDLPAGSQRTRILDRFPVPLGSATQTAALDRLQLPDSRAEILLVDHLREPGFFARDGIYDDPRTGQEYPDTAARYLFFCRAVCESLKRLERPVDVLHLNDNQTAFTAAFVRRHYAAEQIFSRTGILLSLHNMGYQGIFGPEALDLAQIHRDELRPGSPFEFFGKVNFLKVGIEFSDLLTTVSERYAEEIRTGPQFGFGLEGLLESRSADLRGILNGIDDRIWDPERDPHIAAHYNVGNLTGKQVCRAWLAHEANWPEDSEWPIVAIISRLVEQKGFDLIQKAIPQLLRMEARFYILGKGEKKYEELVADLARKHPDRVHARIGFDEELAHRVEAGADLFMMPSRYEPCGLNQMISLRYGTIPVVRGTGGLADTVRDFDPQSREGTGFVFLPYEPAAMIAALKRAMASYRQPRVWNSLVANAMAEDFSWQASASAYEAAYGDSIARAATKRPANPTHKVS